ncbi:nucleoside-diphosphate-sugar pyrophosphorylase [Leptospira kobayashii]|uniref:Nucleoside-diphosphate-sugar pyrophosphorylase n=1 Tax=Leptospira kobayashii TaxID=1917830 RepID=A0ABN6K854_9LEPT|nr:NTP transferase domain-containing protein [Leptospira kobayashii]BDA77137.1 nucleoside-diphosphate-sugar pyrophosphorylase [Leptospira kobayashii]
MKVFFLAAGFGKRMGDWTKETPKPLLKIDGISFLDYSFYLANRWGLADGWINVHYLGEKIVNHLKDFKGLKLQISYEKKEILGTAGGIKTAIQNNIPEEPILLMNPDTLLFPKSDFKIRTDLPGHSKIHLYLQELKPNENYTKIHLTDDGKIEFGFGNYYYIGLSILDPSVFDEVPADTYYDLSIIFKNLVKANQITGEVFAGTSLDLGEQKLYEDSMNQNIFGEKKESILKYIKDSFSN